MDFTPRAVDEEDARRYVAEGFWGDDSLGALLGAGLRDAASHPFTVRSDRMPYRGTLGEVDALARRVAAGLRGRGIGPGDAVAFQLPNWREAAATFYAITYLGAVVVPIVHFYGSKEVGYILRKTGVKALVTADRFGHQDFLANLAGIRGSLNDLEWVAIVGDATSSAADPRDLAFSELVVDDPIEAIPTVDPRSPALVAYTSGTTSDPKGVVHSHRTINAEIHQLSAMQNDRGGPAMITGAPVGHGIGMLAALLVPVFRRSEIHLIDVWDPGRVLQTMLDDGLSAGQGSTYFLTSLLDHPDYDLERHVPLMPFIGLGGSAVPAAVGERCAALGIEIARSFGSTEHPSITGSRPDAPHDKRVNTDGRPLPGVEIRLVDDDGKDVEVGTPGEIWSRGPDLFAGYTDAAATEAAFSADGWFMTGDIGVLDDDGYLAITDRKKDIIIRGGENVSAQEVEELLVRMPDVAEVAVVAAPDARLGEVACAFFRMQPGRPAPELAEVRAYLERAGIARQKWPEQLRSVDEFPRTPSGKIQKFVLRRKLGEDDTRS
ncbi:MAG: acyl-CoA synthetase [Actinomycetota bacterium]|jgi:acyl-CoA synthetase (AMP-forming)/AMP-acid ligase II|nr:acyl-CoA synthetase [Actinomycetota bacterium]